MISREEPLWCDDERRNAVLTAPAHPLNGLDYVEYRRGPAMPPDEQFRLEANFLKPPPPTIDADAFTLEGGVRVVDVTVIKVALDPAEPRRLFVYVDREGDFSTYWLHVADPAIDPERSEAPFSFKAGCPSDLDCAPAHDCQTPATVDPPLDYLAKDYQSFRRLLMDLAPQLNPDFTERSPADLTVALIELFATVGDYLSYFQDAAATEAFFDTCRRRVSAARHAQLIDYRMHNGRNAHGFVQFDAQAGGDGVVLAGTGLTTRVARALRGAAAAPPLIIPTQADFDGDAALAEVTVFETAAPVRVLAARNRLRVHDWGDAACCLARGAREAWLFATTAQPNGDLLATRPDFAVGEYLLLEEVLGVRTGLAADADAMHRHVVRLELVEATVDGAFGERLAGGALTAIAPGDNPLPLLHVRWRERDAPPFTFRLSAKLPGSDLDVGPVTIARGNVTPTDHGRTVSRRWPDPDNPRALPAFVPGGGRWPVDTQPLIDGPLTFQVMPDDAVRAADGRLVAGRHDLDGPATAARAAAMVIYGWTGLPPELYAGAPSLLAMGTYDQRFVAEPDDDGTTALRFGDDQYGRRPVNPKTAWASYRIGNGRRGNIGAGALQHVVMPADLSDPANPSGPATTFPVLAGLYQPLAMDGGVDPESVEQVRQLAPAAMRAETYRAVTEQDYAAAALRLPQVAAAKARFVWTGSWHTVFVALHPHDRNLLDRLPGGAARLNSDFAARARRAIGRFALADYELAIHAPRYVPVTLEAELCVKRGAFRGDVLAAADAVVRDLFAPDRFAFGDPIYASRVLAALQAVDGVDSVRLTKLERFWSPGPGALGRGLLALAPDEVVRLDNDPSQPEFGRWRLDAVGGL